MRLLVFNNNFINTYIFTICISFFNNIFKFVIKWATKGSRLDVGEVRGLAYPTTTSEYGWPSSAAALPLRDRVLWIQEEGPTDSIISLKIINLYLYFRMLLWFALQIKEQGALMTEILKCWLRKDYLAFAVIFDPHFQILKTHANAYEKKIFCYENCTTSTLSCCHIVYRKHSESVLDLRIYGGRNFFFTFFYLILLDFRVKTKVNFTIYYGNEGRWWRLDS